MFYSAVSPGGGPVLAVVVNPASPIPLDSLYCVPDAGPATGGCLLVADRLRAEVSLLEAEFVLLLFCVI